MVSQKKGRGVFCFWAICVFDGEDSLRGLSFTHVVANWWEAAAEPQPGVSNLAFTIFPFHPPESVISFSYHILKPPSSSNICRCLIHTPHLSRMSILIKNLIVTELNWS